MGAVTGREIQKGEKMSDTRWERERETEKRGRKRNLKGRKCGVTEGRIFLH